MVPPCGATESGTRDEVAHLPTKTEALIQTHVDSAAGFEHTVSGRVGRDVRIRSACDHRIVEGSATAARDSVYRKAGLKRHHQPRRDREGLQVVVDGSRNAGAASPEGSSGRNQFEP